MIKIHITEDQEVYLEGLALLLAREPDMEVTGTSLTGSDLIDRLPSLDVDLLLLDVHLPDVDEETLIKTIRIEKPYLKIIYLTMVRGTRMLHRLLKYGIQGYILKNASIDELFAAIRSVHGGGTYFSKETDLHEDKELLHGIVLEDTQVKNILSRRETEILKMVCKEYSNAQIAKNLFISINTVETHRKNIIAKLGVNNTVGLVKFALKNHLLD